MAAVKISDLDKFTKIELANANDLLIPASKGDTVTKTLNMSDITDLVSNNVEIWDLETFHDDTSSSEDNQNEPEE